MRAVKIRLTPELIQQFFTEGWSGDGIEVTKGLPEDAVYEGCKINPYPTPPVVELLFSHPSFKLVHMPDDPPDFVPEFTHTPLQRT